MKTIEAISLAGEYAVASELCRRGNYAQLTFGNHKKTDILIENKTGFIAVSVKTKTGPEWFRVTGIWKPNDVLILVDYHKKSFNELPDFYVLTVSDWKKVVKSIQKRKGENCLINEQNTLYWEPSEGRKRAWIGCSVKCSDVDKFKDRWDSLGE